MLPFKKIDDQFRLLDGVLEHNFTPRMMLKLRIIDA